MPVQKPANSEERTETRFDRRRAQTRRALISAARALLAEEDGVSSVSIQQIADRADVGFGSFYNHFDSKTALFDAAVTDALEEYGQRWTTSWSSSTTRPRCSPPASG